MGKIFICLMGKLLTRLEVFAANQHGQADSIIEADAKSLLMNDEIFALYDNMTERIYNEYANDHYSYTVNKAVYE